ncbi:TVP38/TMEM64 family protein [Candidatus Laterigemmans baculatus]|uniref:TVP38/TMEM64 family protein n=1 Tax=Candidatus Laterigemmans baculatus TaxID=2770505 RepID=UPI0013DB20C5|nr:TVP38/TMEM64 family protein [Candidatus Laterigemmans baculatus]
MERSSADPSPPPAPPDPGSNSGGLSSRAKITIAAGLVVALVGLSLVLRDWVSLAVLLDWEQQLREWQESHPLWVYIAAFALYVLVTGASLPGAVPLSVVYGWYFGFLPAVVLISFASTSGATLAFLSSRYLLRDAVERRFGARLRSINDAIRREGVYYLITARLIPGVPFVVINLVMGLTPIRVGTFWWASQLGMLPGTLLYVWVGSAFPDLQTLVDRGVGSVVTAEIVAAFLCLALFPLAIRQLVAYVRRRRGRGLSEP